MTRIRNTTSQLRQTGLTIIELMITLAVLAILLAIAIPSFEGLIASTRVSNATNELLAALAQARSEAIRRGQRITMCPSNNGIQCTNNNWDQGWIVFRDAAHTGIVATRQDILHVSSTAGNNILIQSAVALQNVISFSSDGQSRTLVGLIQAGNIEVCSTSTALSDNNRSRRLLINGSGQVVITQRPINTAGCPIP